MEGVVWRLEVVEGVEDKAAQTSLAHTRGLYPECKYTSTFLEAGKHEVILETIHKGGGGGGGGSTRSPLSKERLKI